MVNLGGRLYSRKIMCRIQWHFRSNLQTSSYVWLFKEYDFVLADLNKSVFTTLCCNIVAIWRYQLLSYLTSDSRCEPIDFYNILVSDHHDLTLSINNYLPSDRRSHANTILIIKATGFCFLIKFQKRSIWVMLNYAGEYCEYCDAGDAWSRCSAHSIETFRKRQKSAKFWQFSSYY